MQGGAGASPQKMSRPIHTGIPASFQAGVHQKQMGKRQAQKSLQKFAKKVTPLLENLWVFLSKGPRHTLHARCMQKQLQGARARFQPPWLTAHRKSRESPKHPRKTYRKVSLNLCGGLVVVWEGHSDGGGLCATSSGASSEGSSQQQREAKSQ